MNDYHYNIDVMKYVDKMKHFCQVNGVKLNLVNPVTIQDKLAWLNIYDENPLKVKCADKIQLRDYSLDVLGEDLCVPIIKVYDNVNDIDWNELPNQFVIKCNHGSGMNIIVKDKSKLDVNKAVRQLNVWMKDDFSMRNGFEAHYHDIPHKIFAEEYKECNGTIPYDYKFLCFNGEPVYVQLFAERFGKDRHMNYYDMDFNYVNLCRRDFKNNLKANHKKPTRFNDMIEIARKLANPFKFVRVDLYCIDDKIYLGELTFTPGACVFKYKNDMDNKRVGDLLNI